MLLLDGELADQFYTVTFIQQMDEFSQWLCTQLERSVTPVLFNTFMHYFVDWGKGSIIRSAADIINTNGKHFREHSQNLGAF